MSDRIAKHVDSSAGRARPGATTGVPVDATARLRAACAVWIGLWIFGLVMNNIVGPLVSPDRPLDDAWPYPANPVAFTVIAVSVILFLYLRRVARRAENGPSGADDAERRDAVSPGRVLDLALAYEVLLAAAIGIVNQWTPNTTGLSWICVVVLVHPLIVPDSPGRTLAAALVAASMDPVGVAITALRGVSISPVTPLIWAFLPTYVCAVLSVLPASLVVRLRREISSAREMGSYRLGERLGGGGMGEVYRAQHRLLARPAAIKLIRPDMLGRAGAEDRRRIIQRFEREAQAIALLRSPHTVALYDYGITDDGALYYVMELLDGFDLDTFVRRFGAVPPVRAVHLLRQVCDSLAEAHDRGLIHRDVKPANVCVCRRGRSADLVKVLDFGLVKALEAETDVAASGTMRLAGTPAFMSPEQALGQPVDARTDLYAVGCLGHFLLTGRHVFEGRTALEIVMKHATETPSPPSASSEFAIPRRLDEVVLRCLEKDPARRPATADALSRLLGGTVEGTAWSAEEARRWWDVHDPEPAAVPAPLAS
jgi:serine/threonine-protein kinase